MAGHEGAGGHHASDGGTDQLVGRGGDLGMESSDFAAVASAVPDSGIRRAF